MIKDIEFLIVLSWEEHVVDVLNDCEWLNGYLYELLSELKTHLPYSHSMWKYKVSLMVSHMALSHCITCIQLHTVCYMHSLARHVIQWEHQHITDLHQLPASLYCQGRWYFLLYFGAKNLFFSMLNVKLWVYVYLMLNLGIFLPM